MSGWAPYIEFAKKSAKNSAIKAAGLFGQDGAKWAADSDAEATGDEVKALVAGLGDVSKLQASAPYVKGKKFMYLSSQGDGTAVCRAGPTSLVVRKTKKAIIVALTSDGANPADAVVGVAALAKDLEGKGF